MSEEITYGGSCPVEWLRNDRILLAHGGGGRLMGQLMEDLFRPAFDNAFLREQHDGAVIPVTTGRIALTSDGYVVKPRFFPGGDIGSLSIYGSVNDLAMCGATPHYLTANFILEEGLEIAELRRVVESMRAAADRCGVSIVAGDTKVVERGKADGLYLGMTGVGRIEHSLNIGPAHVQPGDAILISGDVGRHGVAVMAAREGLQFSGGLPSDAGPVHELVSDLLAADVDLHCLRDLTRGGLAAALVEIAQTGRQTMEFEEHLIPVAPPVEAACEMLGLDPLLVACEGRFIAFVPQNEAEKAIGILKRHPVAVEARQIGTVTAAKEGRVVRVTSLGLRRYLDLPSGEQLPRIC